MLVLQTFDLVPGFYVGTGDPNSSPFDSAAKHFTYGYIFQANNCVCLLGTLSCPDTQVWSAVL